MNSFAKHALGIAALVGTILTGATIGALLYGAPIGLGVMTFGARLAAFGGETIHTTAPGCDEAALLAAVSEVVGDAMTRPVVVARKGR